MNSQTADAALPAAAAAASRRGPGMLGLLAAMVVTIAASAGLSWYFVHARPAAQAATAASADGAVDATRSPPLYQPLEPAFVVNLEGTEPLRFLQVQIELMARDPAVLEATGRYNPRIRNAVLLLLGQQRVDDLHHREGKERLQAEVLAEIQAVLRDETGKPGVEAVYFSSFVMQ